MNEFDVGQKASAPKEHSSSHRTKPMLRDTKTRFALELIAPAFVAFLVFQFYPVIRGAILSFYEYGMYTPIPRFVGLDNYVKIFQDPIFTNVVIPNTLLYTFATVSVELSLGLAVAILINRNFRGQNLVRTILLLPLTVSPVISGLIFKWIFNDQFGLVNVFLRFVGAGGLPWLASRWPAFLVTVLSDIWTWTPLFVVVIFAALQTMPKEPFEAAYIDGASAINIFWFVTLPLLAPVMLVVTVLRMFDSFRAFDNIWTITGGGPGRATEVFGIYVYKEAFVYLDFGAGAAVALLGTLIICLIGILSYSTFARIIRYERTAAYTEGVARGVTIVGETRRGRWTKNVLVGMVCLLILIPILYLILTAFRPPNFVFYVLQGGWRFSLTNFIQAVNWHNFATAFRNSTIVATASTLLALVLAIPSGYMLGRFENRISDAWFFLIYIVRAIPYITWLIPLYLVIHSLGLYDTFLGVIFPHAAVHITFISWVGRGFFENIPIDVEEAAYLDGCSRWKTFLRVVLPQCIPALIAIGVIEWLWSWNELLFSLILTSRGTPLLTPTIAQFVNEMGVEWGTMAAAGVLSLVPAVLVTFFGQRYIVRGLGRL